MGTALKLYTSAGLRGSIQHLIIFRLVLDLIGIKKGWIKFKIFSVDAKSDHVLDFTFLTPTFHFCTRMQNQIVLSNFSRRLRNIFKSLDPSYKRQSPWQAIWMMEELWMLLKRVKLRLKMKMKAIRQRQVVICSLSYISFCFIHWLHWFSSHSII